MLTKRLLRSSTLLLASIVAYAVYYFVHDLVYPPTHKHAVDTASKWSDEGKAIWLGVGAAEAPEPVVDTAEIPTEAEIEKMKIKELKVPSISASLLGNNSLYLSSYASRPLLGLPRSPRPGMQRMRREIGLRGHGKSFP